MEVPREMKLRYLDHRKNDLEKSVIYVDQKNFQALENIGHQLKGNGLTFGHPELSRIGRELEESARFKNLSLVLEVLEKFSLWVCQHPS